MRALAHAGMPPQHHNSQSPAAVLQCTCQCHNRLHHCNCCTPQDISAEVFGHGARPCPPCHTSTHTADHSHEGEEECCPEVHNAHQNAQILWLTDRINVVQSHSVQQASDLVQSQQEVTDLTEQLQDANFRLDQLQTKASQQELLLAQKDVQIRDLTNQLRDTSKQLGIVFQQQQAEAARNQAAELQARQESLLRSNAFDELKKEHTASVQAYENKLHAAKAEVSRIQDSSSSRVLARTASSPPLKLHRHVLKLDPKPCCRSQAFNGSSKTHRPSCKPA